MNTQIVSYVGSSVCNALKLKDHDIAQGLDVKTVMETVIGQLSGVTSFSSPVNNGQHVGAAADLGAQIVGTAQNSGLSGNTLA